MTIEELQEELLQQKEANQELQSKVDGLTKSNEELKASNEKLIDYNNKLFMRVGNQLEPQEPKEEERDPEDVLAEEIINDIIGEK